MQGFVKDMIVRLSQAQVEFVVVGGVSAVLQGVPITTVDLDICYRRTTDNMARRAEALVPLQPRLRGFPTDLPFTFDGRALQLGSNFTLEIGGESLDLLGVMSGIGGYEQVIGQVDDVTVGGYPVKALSLMQLITTKEAAVRPKDLAALPVIKATLELLRKRDDQKDVPPANP